MNLINKDELVNVINNVVNTLVDIKIEKVRIKIDEILGVLHKQDERIKCLEVEKMKDNFITERKIDEYISEGYDRVKDDKATEEVIEIKDKCFMCGGEFAMDELDIVNGELYCQCCEDEVARVQYED